MQISLGFAAWIYYRLSCCIEKTDYWQEMHFISSAITDSSTPLGKNSDSYLWLWYSYQCKAACNISSLHSSSCFMLLTVPYFAKGQGGKLPTPTPHPPPHPKELELINPIQMAALLFASLASQTCNPKCGSLRVYLPRVLCWKRSALWLIGFKLAGLLESLVVTICSGLIMHTIIWPVNYAYRLWLVHAYQY